MGLGLEKKQKRNMSHEPNQSQIFLHQLQGFLYINYIVRHSFL